MASKRGILQLVATAIAVRHGPKAAKAETAETPYTGLLAELPPVHPVLYDPEGPPIWFARLCLAASRASLAEGDDKDGAPLDIEEEWKEFQLRFREAFDSRQTECLLLLCQHFDIDIAAPEAGWELAKALAQQHVPAFQLERAAQKQRERRAKKPTELDVEGSLFLFLCDCLDHLREKRVLSVEEESYREKWDSELKARIKAAGLAPRTISSLKKQMRGAHLAYWEGSASDFQRQFVEEVEPAGMRLFKDLRWFGLTPSI